MTSLVSACSITGRSSITQAVVNAGMHVGVAVVLTARLNEAFTPATY